MREGRGAELCSMWANGPASSSLCGLGEAGMYWVGFYFLLSGFVGAYNQQDPSDDGMLNFTWSRLRTLVPAYAASLGLGFAAAAIPGSRVPGTWDRFGSVIFTPDGIMQGGRALVVSNVLLWPFSYGSLSGSLSHLWYLNTLWPLLCRFPSWMSFLRQLPRSELNAAIFWCWLATVIVPWANLNHFFTPHHGWPGWSGDLLKKPPLWMVYFIYYHPLTNWMYFAGGVALACLMEHDDRRPHVAAEQSGLLERYGASASLLALGVGLPILDQAHRGNILLRQLHGPLVAPFLGVLLYAGARGKDPLLGLMPLCNAVDSVTGSSIARYFGNISRPAFFLHKPLHELQWNLVELQPPNVPRLLTGKGGMVIHWFVVFGASAAFEACSMQRGRSKTDVIETIHNSSEKSEGRKEEL